MGQKGELQEYKHQLCKIDSKVVSSLVNGCRRKKDGDRFYIGGMAISYVEGNVVDACVCLAVLRMPDLKNVYQKIEMVHLNQPCIPELLAFREVPSLVKLYRDLEQTSPQYVPDIIMVRGNGILHPRGCGLACQLGVILDVPTMGVCSFLMPVQGILDDDKHKKKRNALSEAGDNFDLVTDSGEVLGKCLKTHVYEYNRPYPVYVSIGHKISLNSAVWLALECSKYRLPQPIQVANMATSGHLRREYKSDEFFIIVRRKDP